MMSASLVYVYDLSQLVGLVQGFVLALLLCASLYTATSTVLIADSRISLLAAGF